MDGIVKFWDLRQAAGGATAAAAPAWDLARLCDASVPHISQKQHGITSLALHPQGGWEGGSGRECLSAWQAGRLGNRLSAVGSVPAMVAGGLLRPYLASPAPRLA